MKTIRLTFIIFILLQFISWTHLNAYQMMCKNGHLCRTETKTERTNDCCKQSNIDPLSQNMSCNSKESSDQVCKILSYNCISFQEHVFNKSVKDILPIIKPELINFAPVLFIQT